VLVRIGSRGSRLALVQAEKAALALRDAGHDIAFVPITTAGDRDRSRPFGQIGERGVFVKEIEEALLGGRIDVAVHSAKDMTSTDTGGLVVGAYLERDDPRDALVGAAEIRPGMRIGTASVRRRAQLLAYEPTVSVEPLRGNVDTRLRKARERGLDALVLAACGLDRLVSAARSGCACRWRRCCRRRRRVLSPSRCGRARGSSWPMPTMRRRGGVSRRSVPASRPWVRAALRRSPLTTTVSSSRR
jgi:hydroxymethylbilane synthase